MLFSIDRRALTVAVFVGLAAACSKDNADSHLRKADDYLAKGQLQQAVIEYRTAIQLAPRRGDIRLKLADAAMLAQDPASALKEYVRAADLLPKDVNAQLRAGSMLLLNGSFDDAKARADKALAIDPKSTAAQILRGNALAGLKDIDKAIAEYQESLSINAANPTALANLGAIQQARGNKAEAEANFRKAIEAAPRSLEARMALANFLWATQRVDDTEQVLKDALAIDPANEVVNRTLGVFYLSNNRAADAEPYFQAIAKSAKTIASQFSLADYYVVAKKYDKATKVLRDVAANEKAHTAALIRLAAVAAAQGDRAAATSTLKEILEQRPKEMPARLLAARLLLQDGKSADALAQATSIVSEQPNSNVAAEAYLLIGRIQATKDRRLDAIAAFEQAMKRQAQPLQATLALANLHLSAGALDKARTYAEQALAIDPSNAQARAVMIQVAIDRKDLPDARRRLAALQKDYPNVIAVLLLEGAIRTAEGHADQARAAYEKAAAIAPDNVEVATALVRMDLIARRPKDAISRVERMLKVRHTSDLLLLASKVYAVAGDREKTEEMLVQAIEADPGRRQPYADLGALYVGQNRLTEARERFEQAAQRDPKSVAVNTVLAMIYELQHQNVDAEKQYKAVLAIDSSAPIAANNLAWMYVSANKNLDEALQLAQEAQRSAPNDPDVSDTIGWIYYRKNMINEAVRSLETSAQAKQRDASVHYHLGMAYMQAGNFAKARQSLQQALKLNANFEGASEARSALTRVGG